MSASCADRNVRSLSVFEFYLGQLGAAALFAAAAIAFVVPWGRTAGEVITAASGGLALALWGGWLRYHARLWRARVVASAERVTWLHECRHVMLVGGLLAAAFAAATLGFVAASIWVSWPYGFAALGTAFGTAFVMLRMKWMYRRRLKAHKKTFYGW